MPSVATAYQKKYASIFFAGFALHTFASPLFGVRNDVSRGVAAFGHLAFYTTLSALALSGVMPFG